MRSRPIWRIWRGILVRWISGAFVYAIGLYFWIVVWGKYLFASSGHITLVNNALAYYLQVVPFSSFFWDILPTPNPMRWPTLVPPALSYAVLTLGWSLVRSGLRKLHYLRKAQARREIYKMDQQLGDEVVERASAPVYERELQNTIWRDVKVNIFASAAYQLILLIVTFFLFFSQDVVVWLTALFK